MQYNCSGFSDAWLPYAFLLPNSLEIDDRYLNQDAEDFDSYYRRAYANTGIAADNPKSSFLVAKKQDRYVYLMVSFLNRAIGCLSALLLLLSIWGYSVRPDGLAAATFFPAWVWLFVGLLLTVFAFVSTRRFGMVLLIGWMLFGSVFVEELHSCGRSLVSSSLNERLKDRDGTLVVVSMNCVGGTNALRDLKQFQPDVLCFKNVRQCR